MKWAIIDVDPEKSEMANAIYKYGNEQYETGFFCGAIYTALGLSFLFCLREYIRSK